MLNAEGRPNHVYCNGWIPQPQNLAHDVYTTDLVLCYPEAAITRGPLIADTKLREDANLRFPDGRLMWLEFDNGTEGLKQVRRRFRTYQRHYTGDGILLFVTRSRTRLSNIMAHAEPVQDFAVFAAYQDVIDNPRGPVWIDCNQQVGSIT